MYFGVFMVITGYKKVHVVMPGLEVVRVIKPLKSIGCERLYFIGSHKNNEHKKSIYSEYVDEIKFQLNSYIKPSEMIDVPIEFNNFEELLSTTSKIIKMEKENGNIIFVNISCGAKIFIAAATMACMMFNGVPYYSSRKGFRTKPEDLLEDGKPAGIAIDVEEPVEIPKFFLEPPKIELIKVLTIILKMDLKSLRQGDIIKELEKHGLMENIFEKESSGRQTLPTKRKVSRKAHSEFRTNFFNQLLNEGYVITEGYGRKVEVKVTEKGRQFGKIFSKVYFDYDG